MSAAHHIEALPDGSGVVLNVQTETMRVSILIPTANGKQLVDGFVQELTKAERVFAALNPAPTTKRNGSKAKK